MATISADTVKKLRERTGLGMMDCKKALEETGGDPAKAEELLRKQGLKAAELRTSRTIKEGRVGQYIHLNGKIGVLVELGCETDFVAKNVEFEQLLKELCMQVAATHPLYVAPENVPADVLGREKDIIASQLQGKPAAMVEKITDGKLKDYYKQVCLIEQPFIKDGSTTVKDRISGVNAKLGENIKVRRFVRFEVGEEV